VSGKRSLKKQQKRQASALTQLEELYRRGADDELLARAAEQPVDFAGSPFAAKWAEAADRAVRQSLAGADLGRLERLLRSLRRSGPLRPLAILGEGVLDLAAGRLETARSRLAAVSAGVAAEGAAGALPPSLPAELQALARDAPDLPLKDDAWLRAAADFFAALQDVEARGFAPTAADRQALAQGLRTLRDLAPAEDSQLRRLLAGAGQCLSLLAALDGIEAWLYAPPQGDEARGSQAVVLWLRELGPLAAALGASDPSLLAPLHHAVRRRWRSVLERVAAEEGSPGLAALYAADPGLLAMDVDLAGGLADLRQRAQAQQLLAAGRYEELIQLLRSRSRIAAKPGDLAAFWSLELWAGRRISNEEENDEDDEDEDLGPDLSEPFVHRTLVRVGEMAGEVGRRFPPEQRAEVARVLRDELFHLCEVTGFCEHTAGAALSLLEHLPGDSGLLIAGVAGALADDAPRLLRALEAQLGRGGKASASPEPNGPVERRLMAQVARARPRVMARILDKLKPLFSAGAWPQIAELVGREMAGGFAELLCAAGFEAMGNSELASRLPADARVSLELLRRALGGTLGFAAVELILDCWWLDPPAVEKRLAGFLAGSPGCEGVLAALQVLEKLLLPWTPQSLDVAVRGLGRAAIDRLDDRWQLWGGAVPLLAVASDDGGLQRLKKKIQQLLASPEIQGEGRDVLEEGLEAVQRLEGVRRERERSRRRAQPKKKKPRRPRGGVPQLRLDLS
jgi:hypothetical protein